MFQSNIAFTRRLKGPKTSYGKKGSRYHKFFSSRFNKDNVVTVSSQWKLNGYATITTDKSDTANQLVYPSMYIPLVVESSSGTGQGDTYYWNDGILTGLFSHYMMPPCWSMDPNDKSLPHASNLMLRGNALWGGSVIGSDWDKRTSRFAFTPTASGAEATNVYCPWARNIVGTRLLRMLQYSYKMKERSFCSTTRLPNQNALTTNTILFQGFVMMTNNGSGNTPIGACSACANSNGNTVSSIYEIRKYLNKIIRVKCRNLVIRLPADPSIRVGAGSTVVDDTNGAYRGLFEASSNKDEWQKLIWDIIKKDFFLTADHSFGEPTQTNSDLYARVNPKYKVMRDYFTYIGMNDDGLGGAENEVSYLKFSHRFNPNHPVPHSLAEASAKWADSSVLDTDDAAQVGETVTSTQMKTIKNVNIVEFQATKMRKQYKSDGTQQDLAAHFAAATEEGTTSTVTARVKAAATSGTPKVLLPLENRIVHVRIPRLARKDLELYDLVNGLKVFPFHAHDSTAFTDNSAQLGLWCLTQLCTLIEGRTSFSFINPAFYGKGECLGPDDMETATWGPDETQAMEL
jgi:hypothetical protein